MKFIHAADLHLDSPFLGLRQLPNALWQTLYDAPFTALRRLVDDAIATQVDFVLFSGDIYDRKERSIAAQAFFLEQMQRLQAAAIPVYLSYGNHDYTTGSSDNLQLPANVHIFGNDVETFKLTTTDHLHVQLTGFSYANRAVTEDMAVAYPEKMAGADVAIGLLHGAVAGVSTEHATYAPFTVAELQLKQYDYWALGHIHARQVLHEAHPWIIYPGNLQGRHVKETGAKGYYLVTRAASGELIPEFKAVAPVVWENNVVDAQQITSSEDLLAAIKTALPALPESAEKVTLTLIAVTLKHATTLPETVQDRLQNGSLLAILQRQLPAQQMVVRIDETADDKTTTALTDLDQAYWQAATKQVFTTDNLTRTAGQLLAEPLFQAALANPQTLNNLQQGAESLLKSAGKGDEA
ncbi:metallophosphoesterase family protein [Furfurilactobacillus siliginis]|uniref:Phosphoesterase n=1 Tax=Furfurilactobacillus siliginis TaxID=348151 RepID=A0A0R2L626_9LACO|nr:DNA repair exonuclease [Furfurilactobacillus siliginis]KRN94714.1 metallophosphoesterase [Furfurilactobacillus siliginis]GEK29481.1 phosphoesterase [Furfurilactobacillus siliginis]